MRQMRADATLELQQEQRAELGNVAHSRCTPRAVARRARIVLLTAEGISPGAIDAHFGVSPPTCARGVAAALGTVWRGCATSLRRDAREHWTISAWPN